MAQPVKPGVEPETDCPLCPRLANFRAEARVAEPLWHNNPVPSFGSERARLLIVGLAPGLAGANRTGRPFTGDHAGILLYRTLLELGLAEGAYEARRDDGLMLVDTVITNAVRCVPPANKPTPVEINTCRAFLSSQIAAASQVRAVVALGRIAHDSAIVALGHKRSAFPFGHGVRHDVGRGLTVFDSYHCSRYNTNTGVLTAAMFKAVLEAARDHAQADPALRAEI